MEAEQQKMERIRRKGTVEVEVEAASECRERTAPCRAKRTCTWSRSVSCLPLKSTDGFGFACPSVYVSTRHFIVAA